MFDDFSDLLHLLDICYVCVVLLRQVVVFRYGVSESVLRLIFIVHWCSYKPILYHWVLRDVVKML